MDVFFVAGFELAGRCVAQFVGIGGVDTADLFVEGAEDGDGGANDADEEFGGAPENEGESKVWTKISRCRVFGSQDRSRTGSGHENIGLHV